MTLSIRPFPPLDLPLDGLANEVCSVLVLTQQRLDPGKRVLREPGLHVVGPLFFSPHLRFSSYEVLTNLV